MSYGTDLWRTQGDHSWKGTTANAPGNGRLYYVHVGYTQYAGTVTAPAGTVQARVNGSGTRNGRLAEGG